MKQFSLQNNQLIIKVKPSPLITRLILYPTAFLFFLFPIIGLLLDLSEGNGIKFYSLVIVAIFSLMGFYLLRISLWNTFGEEIIKIFPDRVIYQANYVWFRGKKKEVAFAQPQYTFKPLGDEKSGVLVFGSEKSELESVIQLSVFELEELITNLKKIV